MKKYMQLILVILFPYIVILSLITIFYDDYLPKFIQTELETNGMLLIKTLFAIYVLALISAIVVVVTCFRKKEEAYKLLCASMVIKLIHIPAYLVIFLFSCLTFMAVVTLPFISIFIALDAMSIFLSGLIGLCGAIRAADEKKISRTAAIIIGILQFMFCVDVIVSIVAYIAVRTTKKTEKVS